jgi:hypothetical protein
MARVADHDGNEGVTMKTRLTAQHAEAFCVRVKPMLRLLCRCRTRLEALGFDPESRLYMTVAKAHDALVSLHMELHYESIGHGVGKPPTEE